MSDAIRHFFSTFPFLPTEQVEELLTLGQLRSIEKDDFLIKEGMVCQEVGFILSGIFRSFYYSREAEEITYCFTFPNSFISAYSSYITGNPTPENIQAITPAEVFMVPKVELERLMESNIHWLAFAKRMAEAQYLEMEQRIFTLQKEKAEAKYQQLLTNQPELLQHIPLHYIASYLGITQRHLSRIRKATMN